MYIKSIYINKNIYFSIKPLVTRMEHRTCSAAVEVTYSKSYGRCMEIYSAQFIAKRRNDVELLIIDLPGTSHLQR